VNADCGLLLLAGAQSPAKAQRVTGRLLVRSTNWLGDSVLITPALRSLRRASPRARVAVLAVPPVSELLKHQPDIDEIVTFDRTGTHRGHRGYLQLAGYLRRRRFTHGYLMPNSFDSAFLFWLAGLPHRIGYATHGRGWLLSDARPLPVGILGQHQIFYYLGILRPEERPEIDPQPRIVVTEDESDWAIERLARDGIRAADGPVALIPGAAHGPAKRWPLDRFIEVGKRLVRVGRSVVLFGSAAERELTQGARAAIGPGALDLGGRTNVRQLMALLSWCPVVLCNDSGTMHIAAALGCRIVVPIGSTDPVTTGPWGEGHIVIQHPTACAPCLERHCPLGHHACMDRIHVEEVWAGVRHALGE